ncbi:MAG TPA: hypothetical protein VFJ14_15100, partial [Nocardioidaceae bacterium]|nr:hypothetical protein [Nocardioidaceae bacterium]
KGADAVEAAQFLVGRLESIGVVVERACEDLVTRGSIASRADVTPQAVGLWVRGERYKEDPFPEPYVLLVGGLWLWADVNAWLARHGQKHDSEIEHLGARDITLINAWLLEHQASAVA